MAEKLRVESRGKGSFFPCWLCGRFSDFFYLHVVVSMYFDSNEAFSEKMPTIAKLFGTVNIGLLISMDLWTDCYKLFLLCRSSHKRRENDVILQVMASGTSRAIGLGN